MTFVLTQQQAAACIKAVEDKLAAQPCNHTLRYVSSRREELRIHRVFIR